MPLYDDNGELVSQARPPASKWDALKGLARGLTADLVGFPVDLATQILNLGIAGTGSLLHHTGTLPYEKQTDYTIKKPFLGSDYLAGDENSILHDTGSPEYAAGRFGGNLFPALLGLAKGVPLPPKGQVNALYPGGKESLFLSHGATAENLLVFPRSGSARELPKELYNLSQAVTNGKLSQFGGSDVVLVPRPAKFEPGPANGTVLTATDSYSPRYVSAAGQRIDTAGMQNKIARLLAEKDGSEGSLAWAEQDLRSAASARLADRLAFGFARGGFKQEGVQSSVLQLPEYGQSGWEFTGGSPGLKDSYFKDGFPARMWASPRFQNYKHFESDPRGAAILGEEAGHFTISQIERTVTKVQEKLFVLDDSGVPMPLDRLGTPWALQLRQLAGGFADPMARSNRGRAFDATDRAPFDYSSLLIPDGSGFRPLGPQEITQLKDFAGGALQKLSKAPSDYAELKSFGPTALTNENFAGIINRSANDHAVLQAAAAKRGIPYEYVDKWSTELPHDEVGVADDMLKAGKRPFVGVNGLAKTRQPVATATDSAFFGDPWLDNHASQAGFAKGDFDYMPTAQTELLGAFAEKAGDQILASKVKDYVATSSAEAPDWKAHDLALKSLLEHLDALKAAGKP